jgi:hypothetical protein
MTAPGTEPQSNPFDVDGLPHPSHDSRGVLPLVAAFALGTRLAEWDQERVQPEPPPAAVEDGKKSS